ncbi:glycoside hydrolase family 65 protein [Dyella caseinilytica]|uniref:Glycoside hydrolase family 65 protein n=1 Tax=Dyella caseinilytica TaxID=1849581 RepID=A0ABX7GVI7_9GAMM|nr:glycoside hydrolase family 65 protein [Dyella caseinilytica]QRN54329.1 glycoside hydrolase family 65 protein [Dyella caseinilytica]GFZ93326.1 glycosyl hydrolase [Dyella caseinilytica]
MRPSRLLLVCLALSVARLCGATDPSFLLTATARDLSNYFPGQLGNGYVSTFTSPRGTESNLAYIVGLMDYADGDVSRPAAIPAWSGIDYSTGRSPAGQFWLNQVDVDDKHFQDYRQTLDMYDGVLSTGYRYIDGDKTTALEVTTLVSQASPHLAATQISLTPDFDGEVTLSFPLITWAPHQPRFALAKLDGQQLMEAVQAHQLSLQPIPPATPDRAALWYPGDTRVLASDGDTHTLTLWLDGQAERGARMAEAVAIALPVGVQVRTVQLHKDTYRLALDLQVDVRKGHTYTFTKFAAFSREGWGGDAKADLALATSARADGFDHLRARHEDAWHALWQSDIVIDGDPKAQQIVHSDLYYLLSNATPDTAWPIGACGMTPGYTGHVFWDSDSWVFPALLLLHPERAKSLIMFRDASLSAAEQRAHERGWRGAMYPWEADPDNGTSQTPHSAAVLDDSEIHVDADIAIAQWQYYLATQDRTWLVRDGWPVIHAVADFWVSRATYVTEHRRYEIQHVTSVDEHYNDIPNDTFTNASARKALLIAVSAAKAVGATPDPRWREIADALYVPFDAKHGHYVDFDPTVPFDAQNQGGPLPLLSYPALDMPMDAGTRQRDYQYATQYLRHAPHSMNSMGFEPLSIAAATAGNTSDASAWFEGNVTADVIKPPFHVRTETATNNTGYFMTASGGFLQNILYGFTGLRIDAQGLSAVYPPMLPVGWKSLTLRHIRFRGQYYDIALQRDAQGKVNLIRHVP